ncbi:hypothetical protein BS47DRAFT_1353449, partial [Hydnum rufescens UP504]
MMPVTQLPHIAVPPITSSTTKERAVFESPPTRAAKCLYALPQSTDERDEGIRCQVLRLKFKKLADEL